MKKILLFALLFTVVYSIAKCKIRKKSCKKTKYNTEKTTSASSNSGQQVSGRNPNEMWLGYDETKCDNPWQFNWFNAPTDEQLASAVKGFLEGEGFTINEIRTSRNIGQINCDACNCLNGFHYYVKIPKAEADKLKALKFHEIDSVPAIDNSRE